MCLASIVGARPQFIKLAPVSRALRLWHEEVVIHTSQHYDERLSANFFSELAIPVPDYTLDIGLGGHGMQTGRMVEAIEKMLLREHPDGVVVYGDTNSTLAGALAAVKLHIPVAHVEAGLRSFKRATPEEINRIVTDHVSDRLFCPPETARRRAEREGLVHGVEVVGDVMYDALLQANAVLSERAQALLPALSVERGAYILVTIHRPANADVPRALRRIAQALHDLAMPVVFPVHPRTQHALEQSDIAWSEEVHMIEPAGYYDMLALEQCACRVVTDSGGVQKEASLLGLPCITLRDETEWPETVHMRWNTLVGTSPHAIIDAVRRPAPPPPNANPFGEGDASLRTAQSLRAWPPPSDFGTPYLVPTAVVIPIGLGVSWAMETSVNESTGTQVESAAGVLGM